MRIPEPWFRESTKTWYVQINGRQINLGKNKTEAKAKCRELIGHGGKTAKARKVLADYCRWVKANRAENTAAYRRKVCKSFADFIGSKRAEDIRPFHVVDWVASQKRIKSPTTANDRITLIIGAFNWAVRMGYIKENPIANMPRPKRLIRQEFIPVDAWPNVLALATDDVFKAWLSFMLGTGSRVTEMFKLEACYWNGRAFTLPMLKSKGQRQSRVIIVPDELLPLVEKLIVENPTGAVFRNRRGNPWNRNSIRCRFRRLKRELKMPELTATTLRHSYAHWRLTSGQDSLTVAKLLGHCDVTMLSTRYGHLQENTDYMVNAANKVAMPQTEPQDNGQGQPA